MFSLEALEVINQRAAEKACKHQPEREALFEVAPLVAGPDPSSVGIGPLLVSCGLGVRADDIPT